VKIRSTLCPKNVTTLSCYNSDTHELISIMFGISVIEEVGNEKVLYFPTHLNNASVLPGETGNP